MSRRVRLPLTGIAPGERSVGGDDARYLTRVHRLGPGAALSVFDPVASLEADAELVGLEQDGVRLRIGEPTPARRRGLPGLTLVQCAGKGDKLDATLRAATALGVSRFVIAVAERSVARPAPADTRKERWRAIALDAARQSERGDLPRVDGPFPLEELLANLAADPALKLCLHPEGQHALGETLAGYGKTEVVLLVGPEGGFSAQELLRAADAGFLPVRLGDLVLRTELAATAALGAVLAHVAKKP